MQHCQACGSENTDTARFCGTCGASLVAVGPVGPPPPRQPTLSLRSLLRNRYLVRKLLGQGGMGAVYLAEDQQVFNRLCVVKEMLPYYSTPAEKQQAEQNFEREARLLSSLRNPGIPQIYDYFIEANRYYLVMEWVEGENLEDHMARLGGPLPESDVRDYALQLANILVYISKQNPPVIHRDIKPANIILDDEGQVKLVDFGIAKATTGTGQTGGMSIPLGTPGFSPPEQYSGQVEPRTDVYALGATLHYLLTGRDPRNEPPFQFPPARTLAAGVSPEMEGVLTEMLQLDAALRPTPVELRARLESLVAPQPTAQPQPFTLRSGDVVTSLSELAAACDRHWDVAIEHLYAGDFEPWLEQWNRTDLAAQAANIRRRGGDRSAGLEEFIQAVDHTMPMPAPGLSQSKLDLGTVERGERRTFRVDVANTSRGYLHGEAEAQVPWVRVWPLTFGLMAGEQITLTVTVYTSSLSEGDVHQTIVEVRSNAGLEAIICRARVIQQLRPKSQVSLSTRQLDFGAVLPGRSRWHRIVISSKNTREKIEFSSSANWIAVRPSKFICSRGEHRSVSVCVKTSGLPIDTVHEGELVLNSTTGEHSIPVRVVVESVPTGRLVTVSLINLLVGAILGLIVVGVLGNFALWFLRRNLDVALLVYGAATGGGILMMAGFKIQDTLNLSISLGTGVFIGSVVGSGVGIVLGLALGLLLEDWTLFSLLAGLGLLAGELAGITYICLHPHSWRDRFF